jgi:hypothetical protein
MSNEIKAPTFERNGEYIFDRVVLEYFDSANTRYFWNDNAGAWFEFGADYIAQCELTLATETIDGQDWYAADMPTGVGAHTIIPKFFEAGADLTNGNHAFAGHEIPWDGDSLIDISALPEAADVTELQSQIDTLEDQIAELQPGSGNVAPVGATNLELLELSYSNLAIAIANATASPKPNYTEGGRTVAWADYLDGLLAKQAAIKKLIAAEQEPFELVTEGW